MNEVLAQQTIEDHKYLLELIENRTAIAFFSVVNRNAALFEALVEFYQPESGSTMDVKEWREENRSPSGNGNMAPMFY